ncbi:hypothetical protein AYO44_11145 [Planctomycetaceae bacterium SCGC AG-212-F19]|nr:hypothetical protein AYO44_11145 [Planctomycetaceae bacterium SCGC AG-212-F19]
MFVTGKLVEKNVSLDELRDGSPVVSPDWLATRTWVVNLRWQSFEDQAAQFVHHRGGLVERFEKAPAKPITGVSFVDCKVTEADFQGLVDLPELWGIDLDSSPVTPAILKALEPIKQLRAWHSAARH